MTQENTKSKPDSKESKLAKQETMVSKKTNPKFQKPSLLRFWILTAKPNRADQLSIEKSM
ncbi:MAG TPA: hypothetical protein DEF07_00845 [Nitrosomonas sp.]|uniref:hypothetical protein n=1 Tax=Nitrosomonas sp. TaxID=42353 RepID=UPI000E9C948A|nr:hypothetical protein [Nitrosomonas sp.]GJL74542.1 MAG: hypothetical protein NMNS02_06480 [Nitrosomonas sp.]HBV20254.1 hypothetical protein [Nitrosomonas sp.]